MYLKDVRWHICLFCPKIGTFCASHRTTGTRARKRDCLVKHGTVSRPVVYRKLSHQADLNHLEDGRILHLAAFNYISYRTLCPQVDLEGRQIFPPVASNHTVYRKLRLE